MKAMNVRMRRAASLALGALVASAIQVTACSSPNDGLPPAASVEAGAEGATLAALPALPILPCQTDDDCRAQISPPACATARCDIVERRCRVIANDHDGDGHADANCTAGYVIETGDDCNDNDATIYPGSWDGPADPANGKPDRCLPAGVDYDCDGIPHNKTIGPQGATISCQCDPRTPPPCSADGNGNAIAGLDPSKDMVGICRLGRLHCTADGKPGQCIGAIGPTAEQCDHLDHDCDGIDGDNVPGAPTYCRDQDNDNYCTTNCVTLCFPDAGYRLKSTCLAGIDCNDTNPLVNPGVKERCDDVLDVDCDGAVRDDYPTLGQRCVVGTNGVCRKVGTIVCQPGGLTVDCSVQAGSAMGFVQPAASTDPTIDTSTRRAGYEPTWDWNCDNTIFKDFNNSVNNPPAFCASAKGPADYAALCAQQDLAHCSAAQALGTVGTLIAYCGPLMTECGTAGIYAVECGLASVAGPCVPMSTGGPSSTECD